MRLLGEAIVLSPSDLIRFQACRHAVTLDLRRLRGEALQPAEDTADIALVQRMGDRHELAYLNELRDSGAEVAAIDKDRLDFAEAVERTRQLLGEGPAYIFQAALADRHWAGYADFLMRVERPSELGGHSYEVIDTKLKLSPDPKHLLQLSVYADLLAREQGVLPEQVHVVLGNGNRGTFRTRDYASYARRLRQRLEAFVADPEETCPAPVSACAYCSWREHCAAEWESKDSLHLVAGISRSQVRRLEAAGITSIDALAGHRRPVARLAKDTLDKLRRQAALQHLRRQDGRPRFELREQEPERGLALLPKPDKADLFFDMEGDPYYPEGLEYLFGIYSKAPDFGGFRAIWAHDRDAERTATGKVIDLFVSHVEKNPGAHIYHYAQYEVTALKRLSSRHAVGEAGLDRLLRENRFVDLHRIVRQSLFASEAGYSIKDLEVFYRGQRQDAVRSAMDSMVTYERWRETGDDEALSQIRDYNETDCRSAMELRDWLVREVRPKGLPWRANRADDAEASSAIVAKSAQAEARHQALAALRDRAKPELGEKAAALLFDLAWFHEREDKPRWWAMFDRAGHESDELIDDLECLSGLVVVGPDRPEARSRVRLYRFPEQETKLRAGSRVKIRATLADVTLQKIDLRRREALVKFGGSAGTPPDRMDLIPAGPLDNQVIRAAVEEVVRSLLSGKRRYQAARDLILRKSPRVLGCRKGAPLIDPGKDLTSETIRIVMSLRNSCLPIQGPPGTGKTHVSASAILELLAAGKRVAVSSNSHKAIDNLLLAILRQARGRKQDVRAVKKISRGEESPELRQAGIRFVTQNGSAMIEDANLVGGTAWLFSRDELDLAFDYLFIDEAGQVALANVLAMSRAAANLVLVGDPMQLSQPIQGAHPGQSGQSALEHLLAGHATLPPDRGIFLPVTRRLHPAVCRYISEMVYDGRLTADRGAARQKLIAGRAATDLAGAGLRFIEVPHEGNSQSCPEEAAAIAEYLRRLLGVTFIGRDGKKKELTLSDILVVTPYNAQVNLLSDRLPDGARVGTVDKFQGQEAPVCLISMVTSSGEDLPRNLEFLFSVNRLNVAISRAMAVAVLFASPRLLDVACSTVEQMRLVNALCAAWEYGAHGPDVCG
ncbi:MAG: TM0106 family RecB-like putative nuclease [Alphaproteobacteria bacterium]|nr:TM0106 family RecB-like putative nuclease [Alphaproteobacteria bacterium]